MLSVPALGSFPLAVFLINVVGAFALGVVLEGIVDGSGGDRARTMRLLAGTGFLGGFTTYSALATGIDLLFRDGDIVTGVLYGVGTLVLGLAAAGAGVAVAGGRRPAAGTA